MTKIPELNQRLKIALLINPIAGLGGPAALKGSDSMDSIALQKLDVNNFHARKRAARFLAHIFSAYTSESYAGGSALECFDLCVVKGPMGSDVLAELTVPKAIQVDVLDVPVSFPSSSNDTKNIVRFFNDLDVDLLVFTGGDGTARDVCDAIADNTQAQLVLGVPAGVKMHSGVFAIDPVAASIVVKKLLSRELVSAKHAEIRDIDEERLRQGIVNAKYYGELLAPAEHEYVQAVKQGGVEIEELVLLDLAEEIRLRLSDYAQDDLLLIFAPGTTTHFIGNELGLSTTLLGFDIVRQVSGELTVMARDLNREELLAHASAHFGPIHILITPIGGQGHIIGRGNQQLSVPLLRMIQRKNIWLLSTKSKLEALDQRPLLIDSDDEFFDQEWSGFIPVITGINDQVMYRIGNNLD